MRLYSTPPFALDVPVDALQEGLDRAAGTLRGHSGTITVGDVTLPVRSWEMMADDEREDEARVLWGIPGGETPRGLLSDTGSFTANFTGTWVPIPRRFVARSRRRVAGVWVTVKAY